MAILSMAKCPWRNCPWRFCRWRNVRGEIAHGDFYHGDFVDGEIVHGEMSVAIFTMAKCPDGELVYGDLYHGEMSAHPIYYFFVNILYCKTTPVFIQKPSVSEADGLTSSTIEYTHPPGTVYGHGVSDPGVPELYFSFSFPPLFLNSWCLKTLEWVDGGTGI